VSTKFFHQLSVIQSVEHLTAIHELKSHRLSVRTTDDSQLVTIWHANEPMINDARWTNECKKDCQLRRESIWWVVV